MKGYIKEIAFGSFLIIALLCYLTTNKPNIVDTTVETNNIDTINTDESLKKDNIRTSTETEKEIETVTITSKELYKAYNDNEVNADNLYSGKIGIVTGKIRKISITSDRPCICLSDGKKGSMLGVNCYFANNNQSDQIAKLKKGATITIKGKIRGQSFVDVCLDNCEIQ
ncbi:hypothetical protein UT300005_05960 [Clostridium sp. CTA-5]